jgi:hypothetical protein
MLIKVEPQDERIPVAITEIFVRQAISHSNHGNLKMAIDTLDSLLNQNPEEARCLLNKGLIYAEYGDYNTALPFLEKAATLGNQKALEAIKNIKSRNKIIFASAARQNTLGVSFELIMRAISFDQFKLISEQFPYILQPGYINFMTTSITDMYDKKFHSGIISRLQLLNEIKTKETKDIKSLFENLKTKPIPDDFTSTPSGDLLSLAFIATIEASSQEELSRTLLQYPFIIEEYFINVINDMYKDVPKEQLDALHERFRILKSLKS